MQLYILRNPVGLMQKIKYQALILKLGKLTSQEINPNCRPRVPGAFGNWESRQFSAHYAVGKRTKNNPSLFRVARVDIRNYYIAGNIKNGYKIKAMILSTKRSNVSQWVLQLHILINFYCVGSLSKTTQTE